MKTSATSQIDTLLKRGVVIPEPASVFIDSTVVPERIAPGATVHPFCRIYGAQTSIGQSCVLGAEAPVTIENCQLGAGVKLSGGYFCGATFLDNSSMGSGAHVRPGTLLEELSSGAHAVGLKQTVLFPYVALGSLINFCDCLMAGGTSRKNHSEVGSSYIHFNYTPHQDKATPSLIGDVPRGVLLDQPPIFLGGQGGLVGPALVTFGAIVPAGMIIRKDILNAGLTGNPEPAGINSMYGSFKMVGRDHAPIVVNSLACHAKVVVPPSFRSDPPRRTVRPYLTEVAPFIPGAYRSIDRIIKNNLIYIGNIYALQAWYRHVRSKFMAGDQFQSACHAGALERLETILQERISRLDELAKKMPLSIKLHEKSRNGGASYLPQQKIFADGWEKMKEEIIKLIEFEGDVSKRDVLLAEISSLRGRQKYLESIPALTLETKSCAFLWLQSIVDRAAGIWKTAD